MLEAMEQRLPALYEVQRSSVSLSRQGSRISNNNTYNSASSDAQMQGSVQ